MSARKSVSARSLKSDLRKVDAHIIAEEEYAELPELTDDMLSRATVNKGGRPRSTSPKVLLSVRYSQEVVDFFRATGEGWQTRMDGVLRSYVKRHRKTAS